MVGNLKVVSGLNFLYVGDEYARSFGKVKFDYIGVIVRSDEWDGVKLFKECDKKIKNGREFGSDDNFIVNWDIFDDINDGFESGVV